MYHFSWFAMFARRNSSQSWRKQWNCGISFLFFLFWVFQSLVLLNTCYVFLRMLCFFSFILNLILMVCMYAFMYLYTYIYKCKCTRILSCVYVYIYIYSEWVSQLVFHILGLPWWHPVTSPGIVQELPDPICSRLLHHPRRDEFLPGDAAFHDSYRLSNRILRIHLQCSKSLYHSIILVGF